MDVIIWRAQDPSLKHTLQFGIGLHHAGLADADRRVCEALFVAGKIQERLHACCTAPPLLCLDSSSSSSSSQ